MMDAALLVMDVQDAIVARFGPAEEYLGRLRSAIAAARGAHIPVIYVRVAFRPGFPEVSPRNRSFAAIKERSSALASGSIHPAVAPEVGDVVVTKLRVSAFSGSDLEVLLRAQGIRTLVLSGIATSGVVLSTLREAADRDYGLVVLSDGCLDADAEVHRVLTEKIFPRQADVMSVEEWVRQLQQG